MASILITGAFQGIGREAAFALAKRGHHVVATTHTKEQADFLIAHALERHIPLQVAVFDITKPEDEQRLFSDHAFDVLINNAAIGESGPMSEVPLEVVRKGFEVNVFSTLRVTQAFIRQLQDKPGVIVSLSSVAGRIVIPYLGPYHLTKFALEAMHDALRLEMRKHGVRVHLIEPGYIATGFNERMYASKWRWLTSASRFVSDFAKLKRFEETLSSREHPTDAVVLAIVRAVEDPKAPARLVAPKSARLVTFLARFFPTPLVDYAVKRSLGL